MAENESQSSNWSLASLGTGGPLVFVVALLALLRVYAPPQSEPPKGETSKAPSGARSARPASDSEEGALKPLFDFLRINHQNHRVDISACLEQLLGDRDYSIEVLIATLPDPKRSRVASRFDTMLEAIQRAVESQGYVLDRSKLPWAEPEASTKTITLPNWEGLLRVTIEYPGGSKKTEPPVRLGSILFRAPSNSLPEA